MSAPGGGWKLTAKDFTGLFRRWGSTGNIRALLNLASPVVVVDRYRGVEEGSLRGLTGAVQSPIANQPPAVFFGGLPDPDGVIRVEIELHRLAVWKRVVGTVPIISYINDFSLFTPEAPYNPVLNLAPAGIFLPNLNLDHAFTRGQVAMIGGTNPLAGPVGLQLALSTPDPPLTSQWTPIAWGHGAGNKRLPTDWIVFDPPLRLPAGAGLAVQWRWVGSLPGEQLEIRVTALYHERRPV